MNSNTREAQTNTVNQPNKPLQDNDVESQVLNTISHKNFERSNDVISDVTEPTAPDGGWGWMVVVAVFGGNLLIDGCAGSFGILYPELLSAFGASASMTSMAGSLIVAVYLFSSEYSIEF